MTDDATHARSTPRPTRKPVTLWILQGYFAFNILSFVGVAAFVFMDASFPYHASVTVATVLLVALFGTAIVATQQKWRSTRIVCAVALTVALAMSTFGLFATPPPDPAFDRHKPEIQGASEEAGASVYTVAALVIPVALLGYLGFSRELKAFLQSGSHRV